MSRKTLQFLMLAVLVAVTSVAMADPPARVGRVTVTEKMHWGEDADRMLAALEAQLSSGNAP